MTSDDTIAAGTGGSTAPASATPATADAFYVPLGEERYAATGHTVGPWSPDAQHLGPPSALLVRALEGLPARYETTLARVTVEILGPVPAAELAVAATVDRPGRSVEMVSARLTAGDRPVALARGWRIIRSDTGAVEAGESAPLPPPEDAQAVARPPEWGHGYLDAMEWRSLTGDFSSTGPARLWARQRVPLVLGEEPSPLQRLFTVADSGSGASRLLDPLTWYFINSELTVHVHRVPVGEWIGLDAATVIGPAGTGTAASTLHDRRGHLGRGTQALLVRARA